MKKILAFAAVAVMTVAGAFALDLGAIQGTWKDANYNANWTFTADGTITLKDSTGDVVYKFQDSNVSKFKPVKNDDGIGFSFYCAETERAYTFVKPITLSTDIKMSIDRDWTTEEYDVTMKFQK